MPTTENQPVADAAAWVVGTHVETIVPERFRDDLHLGASQSVAVTPLLDDGQFRFLVTTNASADRANATRLKAYEDSARLDYRCPSVFGGATGLLAHVRDRSKPRFNFQRVDDHDALLVWPVAPLRPAVPTDAGQYLDLAPASKRLHELPTEYAADLPNRFVEAFALAKGDRVAWALSVRDSRLALTADFDAQRITDDGPTVRRVQVHQSGVADALSDQYRVHVPKALVHALDWEDVKLEFRAERQRLVLQPALDHDPRASSGTADEISVADPEALAHLAV